MAYGEVDDYKYIIISKVSGKTLYSVWHKLTISERESAVEQIANILKANEEEKQRRAEAKKLAKKQAQEENK